MCLENVDCREAESCSQGATVDNPKRDATKVPRASCRVKSVQGCGSVHFTSDANIHIGEIRVRVVFWLDHLQTVYVITDRGSV